MVDGIDHVCLYLSQISFTGRAKPERVEAPVVAVSTSPGKPVEVVDLIDDLSG